MKTRVAILGGGPSALFVCRALVSLNRKDLSIEIFEASSHLGMGMPYSEKGARREHVTNVSGNEIPELETSVKDWIEKNPDDFLKTCQADVQLYNDYKVLPRLLFGKYLNEQFNLVLLKAENAGLQTNVYFNSNVTDVIYESQTDKLKIEVEGKLLSDFDFVVMCTGHIWPTTLEGKVKRFFDSPYPPEKLTKIENHAVAITGTSLTAIDAVRTLARQNGTFVNEERHKVSFKLKSANNAFKIVMHSRHGLLPCVRIHLADSHLSKKGLLSKLELLENRKANDGFLSLDFVFDKDFKEQLKIKDFPFYEKIKEMSIEKFVDSILLQREHTDPFLLFKKEYIEAEQSIIKRKPIHWKESLAILSFAMNYPAKHFSAEDMLRLQKVLMSLISIVIAFVPQSSCEELMALHEAGCLEIVSVGNESSVTPDAFGGATYMYLDDQGMTHSQHYETYINCAGQQHLSLEMFPFKSLAEKGIVTDAKLKFRSNAKGAELINAEDKSIIQKNGNEYFLKVSGININDQFQPINQQDIPNKRIYIMAVPYIGGFNPDYSGLDFCEEVSGIIARSINESISPN